MGWRAECGDRVLEEPFDEVHARTKQPGLHRIYTWGRITRLGGMMADESY